MSTLKELTWANHQRAERTTHARKLLNGMSAKEYHRYLSNQHAIYQALENQATVCNVLVGIEHVARAQRIFADISEIETEYDIKPNSISLCSVVAEYIDYVMQMQDKNRLLAHIYVRHFGDMYGGQMIRKRNPGSGTMYDFDNLEVLKSTIRNMLSDEMAPEANICFEFAMTLFKELEINESVLDTDNGIIAIALQLYVDQIEKDQGCNVLYNRALKLYYIYRDKTNE